MRSQNSAFSLEKFEEKRSFAKDTRRPKGSFAAGLLSAVAFLAACGGSPSNSGQPGDHHSPSLRRRER
jgi:hypothetical protein